jgi:hypothetical protein
MLITPADEAPHRDAAIDEWVFAVWTPDAELGLVSGHRLEGRAGPSRRAWYWFALVQAGYPLLALTEWNVTVRADALIVKAPELWAEHHCVAPFEQWTVGNEGYAVALDDPEEALQRAYGDPVPVSIDIEWYATRDPEPEHHHDADRHGFAQHGVAHGLIELIDRPSIELDEAPARRWRRWAGVPELGPVTLDPVVAHTGLRAPFAFPDGTRIDWVLTPGGWRSRPG